MRLGRGADGQVRHIPTPFVPTIVKPGKKSKRHVPDPIVTNGDSAAEQLRLLIERIERLDEEARGIADDRRDVFAEAKSLGYDPKGMRTILQLRKLEPHTRQESDAIVETYRAALGMSA